MPSWKRSRTAALWRRLAPAQAGRVLARHYGEGPGAEALLRAFLCERDLDPAAVRFWLLVYDGLSARREQRAVAGAWGGDLLPPDAREPEAGEAPSSTGDHG